MEYIDTHTHNYDEAYAPEEQDGVIDAALAAGVTTLIQPDVDGRERAAMFELVDRHPDHLHAMLGLYPGSVDSHWRDEIDEMLKWRDRSIVAIGEIGLDYHFSTEFVAEQREAFRVQLELASEMDIPVNIHLRDATEDFFKIMEDCRHLHLRGDLHAFSGSYETFCRMERYGDWYAGIGGVVTFRKASLAEVVRRLPLERIVLETDSPYLTPTPYRGQRNSSEFIPIIAQKVAELQGTTLERVAEVTTANARKLFNI